MAAPQRPMPAPAGPAADDGSGRNWYQEPAVVGTLVVAVVLVLAFVGLLVYAVAR
jgi:hypothetical protein